MTTLATRFASLRPQIDSATIRVLVELLKEIGTETGAEEFTEAAIRASSSGKRFRGLLSHFGASLVTGLPLNLTPVLDLAAGLELYQASALVHDDLIDHADTRRGAPTPHVTFARLHHASQWSGSTRTFSQGGAILLGDLLFSAAERALARHIETLPASRGHALLKRYTRMHAEVALGQYLDVRAEHLPLDPHSTLSVEDAMSVIIHKSARYSIVHPTALGAIAGGGDPALVTLLEAILTPWGIAFQLRDDDLGVFGDPTTTGKPAGDDLREGKRTVLLALAWNAATITEREELAGVLGNCDATETDIAQARQILSSRAQHAHEELIDSLVNQGKAALDGSQLDDAARTDLRELAQILTTRTR